MPVTAGRLWDSVLWPTVFHRPTCQTSSCWLTNHKHDIHTPRQGEQNLRGSGVSENQDPDPSSAEGSRNYINGNEVWNNKAAVVIFPFPPGFTQAPYCQEEPEDSHVKDDDSVRSQVARIQCQQPVQRRICNRCGRRCGCRCGNGYRDTANVCQQQPAELSAGANQKSQNQRGKG